MNYWDEMQGKFGFSDGSAIPSDAYEHRSVYIQVINKLAEKYGSKLRAIAYNRPGFHNSCMVLFYTLEDIQAAEITNFTEGEQTPDTDEITNLDEAMRTAIQEAYELDLDSYIQTVVQITPEFDELLSGLH
jgi:hypothetical protein